MALILWRQHPEGRGGEITDRAEREWVARWTAITLDPTVGELDVLTDPGCPPLWGPFISSSGSADAGAWCYHVRADVHPQDPTVWHVVAKYSRKISRPDLWEIPNPLARPAVYERDNELAMVPMDFDADGYPVRSLSEGRFDPPPEKPEVWRVVRVTKNLPAFNGAFWLDFENAVNVAPWQGYAKGAVWCRKARSRTDFENGVYFEQMMLELVVRKLPPLRGTEYLITPDTVREPWDKVLLNQDLYELNDDTPAKRVPIIDRRTLLPVTTPWPLGIDGKALEYGDAPVWLVHRVHPRMDFSLLPIP